MRKSTSPLARETATLYLFVGSCGGNGDVDVALDL